MAAMSPLSCVEIEARAPATAAVIWLHGLGASGHDFEPLVPHLGLPHARFIFPHAPAIPVTINGGWVMPAWYDIKSLDRRADREDPAEVRASAARIAALLAREQARGIPSERIVLAGFSQGGAMALHVGLRYPDPLAGLLVLSAYLLVPAALAAEQAAANRATPILFCHGSHDGIVPVAAGRASAARVREAAPGRDLRWQEYPIDHEVSPPEIAAIAAWLRERLPPR